MKTVLKYVFNCKANYFFAAITALSYISSEVLLIVVFQILGKYDEIMLSSAYFHNFIGFIVICSLLTAIYLLTIWVRTFFLNYLIQTSNRQIFKDMTYSLMKSSLKYYKGRSSSDVLEKYAVDLGSLDSILIYHLQQ